MCFGGGAYSAGSKVCGRRGEAAGVTKSRLAGT